MRGAIMDLQQAEDFARRKMDKWGLKSWKIAWDDSSGKTDGCCVHQYGLLTFNPRMTTDPIKFASVVYHELAHALLPNEHKYGGHTQTWHALLTKIIAAEVFGKS